MTNIKLIFLMLFSGCLIYSSEIVGKDELAAKSPILTKQIQLKVEKSLKSLGDNLVYPRSVSNSGSWKTVPIKDWTSGFFPGILWYSYELTGDKSIKKDAKKWTEGLSLLQFFPGSHDIGFMINCSFGNGYRLTKDENYRKVILQTAKTLMTRYNPKVKSIRSWDHSREKWDYPVIIDNMMNLELLFWAAQNGGTKEMYETAVSHAETTMKNHFRTDGSTYHVVDYDTTDGNVKSKDTHQGYSDESCWARGQAWAIYGFTMAYRFTRNERFLQTAQKAADYFINNLPEDNVPYWDFNAPNIPNEPRDASAASIASAALLELSGYGRSEEKKTKYYSCGAAILESLSSAKYFLEDENSLGIIGHAVGNRPGNLEVDVTLIYGDYYYLEALIRYKQLNRIN